MVFATLHHTFSNVESSLFSALLLDPATCLFLFSLAFDLHIRIGKAPFSSRAAVYKTALFVRNLRIHSTTFTNATSGIHVKTTTGPLSTVGTMMN